MTVKELIQALSEKDPNARVYWPLRNNRLLSNKADPVTELTDAYAEVPGDEYERKWESEHGECRKMWITPEEFDFLGPKTKERFSIKAVIIS